MEHGHDERGEDHDIAGAHQCSGRAIYLSNICKLPIDPTVVRLPANREAVFSNPGELIEHHNCGRQKHPRKKTK
jgi:hypothetical protein